MPDFRASISSGFDPIDDRFRQVVEDFQQQKEEKKPTPKEEEIQKTSSQLLSRLANELTDTSLLSKVKEHKMLHLEKNRIIEALREFLQMLALLSKTDESHNAEFILQISIVWNHVLDHASFLKMIDIHKSIDIDLLRKFISSIDNYPEEGDFSLSYYMMLFPGEQWHPFPLMRIFQHLHQEAQYDLATSKLQEWMTQIERVVPQEKERE